MKMILRESRMMSKYCEQCGVELEDNVMYCTACGARCHDDKAESEELQNQSGNKNKKKLLLIGGIALLLFMGVIGIKTGFFSELKKGYDEAVAEKIAEESLTEDGNAYKMTVQEYCDRFNQIASESWCSGDEEILRIQVEQETRDSLEEAAEYDPDVEEQLLQTMTPMMIMDMTLLVSEDTAELSDMENYLKYTYTNRFSFIPDNIGVQILAKKDTNQIVGIAARFPMDYRNVGDRFGKLICDSFGEDTDEFQELYIKMKEAGGYGHMYKDGTVFELMYFNNSEKDALFKMSACTKEHYEEAWINNPDLPSKENPIKNVETDSEKSNEKDSGVHDAERNDEKKAEACGVGEPPASNLGQFYVHVQNGYLALRNAKAFDSSNEIGKMYNGDYVLAIKTNEQYWYVYSPSLRMYGYTNSEYLTTTPAASAQNNVYSGNVYYASVEKGYLALRNAPAFDSSNEIGKISNGQEVNVLDTSAAPYWYVYVPALDQSGYVNSDYLR